MNTGRHVRLNLGSGKDYIPGWVNVDIEKSYHVDVVADLSKPFPFQDASVDEILASDILEHFTKESGLNFLRECYRVLKPGGTITIRTHNIDQIFSQFKNDKEVLIHFLYGETSETGVFGAHKFAYTEKSMQKVLKKIGFLLSSIAKEQTNFVVKAKKIVLPPASKLNIGIIMQSPDIGGAETFMDLLIRSFLANGHKVTVATNQQKFLTLVQKQPIKTKVIPFILDINGNKRGLIKSLLLLPYAIVFYSRMLSELKKNKVDVLLMSGFSEKMVTTFLAPFFSLPVVWIEYGPLAPVFHRNFFFPKIIYRLLKHTPKTIVVPSENTKKSLITDARASLAKLIVIPCGVSIPPKKSITILPEWKGKKIIGNISRATKEKGQAILIKAMPMILKAVPDARLILIGDGPDRPFYEKLIHELKLEDSIKIIGFAQDTNNYYQTMTLFAFPSMWDMEGFGMVVSEAMMHGLAVVGSDLGPVRETVSNGKTGILVKSGDIKAFAAAIILLLQNNEKRNIFGVAGKQKAMEEFEITKIAKRYEQVLYDATL